MNYDDRMDFREIATFDVQHGKLSWPWITFAADARCAFATSQTTFETRLLQEDGTLEVGPGFTLPEDLSLPETVDGHGIRAFSLSRGAELLAVTGASADGSHVLVTLHASGEQRRARIDALVGDGFRAEAVAFDRSGSRLWLSAESETETALVLVDAVLLVSVGVVRSPAFPRPAIHELHLHPHDDAVLLLAAAGEEGTFARVVGFAGDVVSSVPTELDSGSIAAGFVGFSADGARVHLVEADELRTHAWPILHELSSVELADDFVSSFSGAVFRDHILIDGEDAESREDAVMDFDRSATRSVLLPGPAPRGMWAGRLGSDVIITVESKGDPSLARALRCTIARALLD